MDYTIKLSSLHVQNLGNVLAQGPYNVVAPILKTIQDQITLQDNERQKEQNGPEVASS